MSKTVAIIKREFLTTVKTKGFIIGTALFPVFLVGLTMLPAMLMRSSLDAERQVAVIDQSQMVQQRFEETLEQETNDQGRSIYNVEIIDPTATDSDDLYASLNQRVMDGELDAYVIFPRDVKETNQYDIYTKNTSNFQLKYKLDNAATDAVSHLRMQESGLDPDEVRNLTARVRGETYKVSLEGATQESGEAKFWVSYIMVFLLYFVLLMYGVAVMRSVIEDKNSRVVEVIISSAKPNQYMAGKVLGAGAVGLVQFLIWIGIAAGISIYGLEIVKSFNPGVEQLPIPEIPFSVYVYFLVYFILGYFLYATLYAAIGSMVNQESEAQNLQWPVMLFLILSLMLMFLVINTPDSPTSTLLSLFPFFTPMLMFLRITLEAAPLWQVLLSIGIMVLTISGCIWLAGRIFRIGILMYGKRPTLPEVMKWIKHD